MIIQEIKEGLIDSLSNTKIVASIFTINLIPQFDWGIFSDKMEVEGRFFFGVVSFLISFIYLVFNVWKRNSERKKIDQETEALRIANLKNQLEYEAAHKRNMAEAEELRAQNAILSNLSRLEHVESLDAAKKILKEIQEESHG